MPRKTQDKPAPIDQLCQQLEGADDLPAPRREYRFHPTRRWRLDLAWIPQLIAVEVEGGSWPMRCKPCQRRGFILKSCRACQGTGWMIGRHTRGKGFEEDCRKYIEAQLLGFTIYRVTPGMIRNGEALAYIRQALTGEGN